MTAEKEKAVRQPTSLIQSYLSLVAGSSTPEIFKMWSIITLISGVLSRNVWVMYTPGPVFPNMYNILVGPPAVGKSMSTTVVSKLWRESGAVNLAPAGLTKQSLTDEMGAEYALTKTQGLDGNEITSSQLAMSVSELGNFMVNSGYDRTLLAILNEFYDSLDDFEEKRRTIKEPVITKLPNLTMLAGTTPKDLSQIFPPDAYEQGFMSRALLIWEDVQPELDLFSDKSVYLDPEKFRSIIREMQSIATLRGEMKLTTEAREYMRDWYATRAKHQPNMSLLNHYKGRRHINLTKLATICSVAESNSMVIELRHFEQASALLLAVESRYPAIFNCMTSSDDSHVMDECLDFVREIYKKKNLPVDEMVILSFLRRKTQVQRISFLLGIMTKSGMLLKATKEENCRSYIPGSGNVAERASKG